MKTSPSPALAAALLLACAGAESDAPAECPPRSSERTCPVCTPPSPKLQLHPDGAPGRYVVLFMDTVPEVSCTADRLAARYGGTIVYDFTALCGFVVEMPDANAPLLAEEPDVCLVEQDTYVYPH